MDRLRLVFGGLRQLGVGLTQVGVLPVQVGVASMQVGVLSVQVGVFQGQFFVVLHDGDRALDLFAQELPFALQRTDDAGQVQIVGRHRPAQIHLDREGVVGGGARQRGAVDGQFNRWIVSGQDGCCSAAGQWRAPDHLMAWGALQ